MIRPLALLLVAAVVVSVCQAYVLPSNGVQRPRTAKSPNRPTFIASRPLSMSTAAEEEENRQTEAAAEDEEADDGDEEEKEEEPQEDPEVTALKKEIEEWDQKVKNMRRQAMSTSDRADDYTKTGYARKVAEMENMRRARKMLDSSNRSAATASVLSDFLPILDKLFALKAKYEDDEFGKQYGALPGAMKTAFMELGVKEYVCSANEPVDRSKMVVIDSVHSEATPEGFVLEALRNGLELQGNPVRMAECIASLGPEVAEEEEDEAQDSEAPEEAGGEEAE